MKFSETEEGKQSADQVISRVMITLNAFFKTKLWYGWNHAVMIKIPNRENRNEVYADLRFKGEKE